MVLAWLACFAPCTHAWDGVLLENPATGQTADFSVQINSNPDASGFWAFGTGAARAELVRYNANGQVQTLRYVDPPAAEPPYGDDSLAASSLTSMPDGGAILSLLVPASGYLGYKCYLQRYQPNGNLRWTLDTGGDTGFNIESCNSPLLDSAGNIWLQTDDASNLLRLGADGSTLAQIALAVGTLAIAPAPDGVYVLGSGKLGKYSAAGELLWQASSPLPVTFSSMLLGSDGNIYAFAATPDNVLAAASFDAAGTQRWSKTFAGISIAYVASTAAAADGRIYVSLVAPSFATQLLAIAPDGSLAWPASFTTQSGQNCLTPFAASVVAASNGDVLLLYAPASFCGASVSLFRFKSDGTQIYGLPLAGDGYDYAQSAPVTIADGSTLLAAQGHFTRVSASGVALVAPPTAQVIANTPVIATQLLAADGGSYFVTNNTLTNTYAVSRFSNTGSLLWQHTDAGVWLFAKVIEGADRVCVAGTLAPDAQTSGKISVTCLLSSSAQALWTKALGDASSLYNIAGRLLADQSLVLVYGWRHALFDHGGNLLHDSPEPLPSYSVFASADINAEGNAVIAVNWGTPQFVALAVDGTTIFYNSGYFGSLVVRQALAARLADDGTAILVALGLLNGITGIYVMRVDPLGHLFWSHLAPVSTNQNSTPLVSIVTEGNEVGVAIIPTVPDNWLLAPPASLVTDLAFDSGAARWNTLLPTARNNAFGELIADPAGSALLLVRDGGNRIALTTIDVASGAIERDRREACVTEYCEPTSTSIDADGALRVLASARDAVVGPVSGVYLVDRPFATPASIRIDQAGLDGAWFPAYEGGQGFTFDWIASASTVFMPWFTFIQSGINDPSGLAWYTLQGGGIAPGATSADLAIAVSDPGAFNSGSVPGRQVGTAHLSFSDCNNGTLLYQFNADTNGGAGGLIALTRLTPSTDPCVLADGSAGPAQNANAPASGFDSQQSGSWFDPAASGQGVEMTIIPPGNGYAGLVFIPWFTFDPAGHADDPLNQHWFTLQGDLSMAANGKVVLSIYRIIGGAFDATPTSNFARVGQATLTLQGCETAQLDWQFDATEVAHAFAGLSGTGHLIKIGGCAH